MAKFSIVATLILFGLASLLFSQIKSTEFENNRNKSISARDMVDRMYTNPIIYSDYSDPDVIRVEDDFYLVSSSFNCTPVIPVLHSKDLVNWKIIGHVAENLPSTVFGKPQHGKGCWAPSIRFHNGEFYVYYGDPDLGIYMAKTKNPAGPWESLVLVKQAKGWIDPCPLWDDDEQAYLVHAWAKSRVGFNSVLTVNRMSADGKRILDDGVTVFDGHASHPTIEGPKFYKRNSYYYIFAPAGGVTEGWQTVLRSKNVIGPYDDKIVLDRGMKTINGPHQGGWVQTQKGESWFVHFQDHGAYGRIIHLQPMEWKNNWPVIGSDPDGDGKGEPVTIWKYPDVGTQYSKSVPQTSDEFDSTVLGLQWQWQANHSDQWYSLTDNSGFLRLRMITAPDSSGGMWNIPNLLLQKFPFSRFKAATHLKFYPSGTGEKSGLLIMGIDYSYLAITNKSDGYHLTQVICKDADKGSKEIEESDLLLQGNSLFLQVTVDSGAVCHFSFSEDGKIFKSIGKEFTARKGLWIGAKVGIFALKQSENSGAGYSDFDWFRIEN